MAGKNLMIVQGGGPTTVFNASLASAIEEATRPGGFSHVWGARSGTFGLSQGDVIDLNGLSRAHLTMLRSTPGAALGSSRHKPTEEGLHRALKTLRDLNVRHLLYMGGNGTMRGAQGFADFCRGNGYDVSLMGVPKTIDNDLAATDRCPGYASAARYVVQSTQELGMDVRSLPQPVAILETMGRSVGWLAAAAAMAHQSSSDAPHLVYVPEVPFELENFLATLDRVVTSHGWAVVVVAEGIKFADGSMVFEFTHPGQHDSLKRPLTGGVARHLAGLVAENLKLRCRSEKPGLLGRSSMAHLSKQDQDDAVLVGAAGVRALLAGETDRMVALLPLGAGPGKTRLVPISEVAGIERHIPPVWLTDGPLAVSDKFRDYLRPLIGELNQYAPEFSSASAAVGSR